MFALCKPLWWLISHCIIRNLQGCESSDFKLISDLFLLFRKLNFQTFNAV